MKLPPVKLLYPMTILSRLSILISLFIFDTGCGFTPLLAPAGKGTPVLHALNSIKIDRIPDVQGQQLRNFLLEQLTGENKDTPLYRLSTDLSFSRQQVGIQKDATTQRMRVVVTAHYTLYDLKKGDKLTENTLKTYSSFNFVDQAFYSNTVSMKAAETAALRTISKLIKLELASFLQQRLTPSFEAQASEN